MSVSEETTVYFPYGDVEEEDRVKGTLDEASVYGDNEKVQQNDTVESGVQNSTKDGKSQSTQGNSPSSGQSNQEKFRPLGKNSALPKSSSDVLTQQSLHSDSLSKSTSSKVQSAKQVNIVQTSSTKNQGRRRESQADYSKATSSMSPGRSVNVPVSNNVEKITLQQNSKVNNAENDETLDLELHRSGNQEKLLSTNDNINLTSQDKKISAIKTNKLTPISVNEKSVCQIKTINDLKKATPRVKFLTDEPKSLTEFRKLHAPSTTNPPTHSIKKTVQTKALILEETRQQLKKYCRTCAGLKLPLVDIFSKKGIQMRLNQQMKHLEVINQQDSLSTQMCMDCICDLKMSYKFFMQIKKAEVKLKSIYISLADANANEIKSRNLNVDKIPVSGPSCTIKEDPDRSTESLRDLLSGANEVNLDDSIPKISAIFSLQDLQETPKSNDEMNFEINIKTEPEEHEEYPPFNQSDDNDSIEEFDPEDPPYQVDSSDAGESEDELESRNLQNLRNSQMVQMQQATELATSIARSNPSSSKLSGADAKKDSNPVIYKYDTVCKSYVKVDTLEKDGAHCNTNDSLNSKIDNDSHGHVREGQTHPNILKRKLPPPIKKDPHPDTDVSSDALDILNSSGGPKDSKMQRLNVQNALNIGHPEEEGIMYVTVKGSKPNELLLVKVKKMDKNIDKKDEKCLSKKTVEVKPVDKILKKYESLTGKDKDLFPERFKKTDIREQIIEEQIEEYKKKREKVLGGTAVGFSNSLKLEDGQVRFVKQNDSQAPRRSLSTDSNSMIRKDSVKGNEDEKSEEVDLKDVMELTRTLEDKSPGDKTYVNTEEYLSRLAKLKQKWEEAKKKRESLQKELDQSYTEGNMEKLARILGEREKNLQDFQDYLKQRKIVITRLKDEDIISLYEDRNNTTLKKSLPDLIDETQPLDYIPEENYLECDYCPETFATREALEEHLKIHDYKIMHYCEDCMEEFPTNKAKRNHNISCLKKLICKYCDFMLDSKGKKRQHEQKHCDSMDGQLCDICGEKFKHQGTLDQHIKTQHMSWEKIFQCPKCPKKFAFKQKLSFHLKSVHTTLRAYLCEDCGADFKNPASLRHHRIRKHQPVGNKRECPVCHKLVPFYSLSKHMHTHKAYTIQCPHCDKMFKNSSTLKQHVRIHEDQRQFRCDTCGVGFNRRDGLRLHMRVHEKTDSRGLKECSCQVCGEKFPNHSMLVIHRNRVHKDGRQYTCHICNRSMISTRSLEWHMSHIHNESLPGTQKDDGETGSEKKRVTCCHCNKTFKTEMILRTHIKNTHMEKDPLKCTECEQTFTSDIRLRHHMMVAHNRLEGTLECPHCPKRFVNHLRLKTHMISHSEERPYTCEICGFNLKTKIQLIKHHQNRHSDERPLQCRYCPWRCKQVSALVCHERTHTNERPYSCSVCRQRFKYLGDKNKHERRHESLGGSGFKRIVAGRNIKQIKPQEEETSSSQDPEDFDQGQTSLHTEDDYSSKFDDDQIIKYEAQDIEEESYEQSYEQDYEETSREASEAAEVIMSMEDTTVYTEEVTADNIETAEMIADEMMTSQILQSGTVVHLQQQDDSGKIQVIPVMLSLPDLTDSNAEVNLATASIMYNN